MSLIQKIQDNKAFSLAIGGLVAAGAAALYYYKKCSSECATKKQCCPKQGSGCIPKTIYDKLGGKVNIEAAVTKFYEKVVKDERVKHFFKNTDMKHQAKQQTDFMCMAFGGPNNYHGKDMKAGHKGMNINDEQFNVIVELLGSTLIEMGVSQQLVGEVAEAVEPLRKDICFQ